MRVLNYRTRMAVPKFRKGRKYGFFCRNWHCFYQCRKVHGHVVGKGNAIPIALFKVGAGFLFVRCT